MVTRMCSPHSHLILKPFPPSSSAHLPTDRFPDTEKASSSHFWFSPLRTFDREILFFRKRNFTAAIVQGKFWRAAAESKRKVTNLHDDGPGFDGIKSERKKQGEGAPPDWTINYTYSVALFNPSSNTLIIESFWRTSQRLRLHTSNAGNPTFDF